MTQSDVHIRRAMPVLEVSLLLRQVALQLVCFVCFLSVNNARPRVLVSRALAGLGSPRPVFPPRVSETPQPNGEQQQGGLPGPLGDSVDEERGGVVGHMHAQKGVEGGGFCVNACVKQQTVEYICVVLFYFFSLMVANCYRSAVGGTVVSLGY